jgi:hypothetical protein
MLTLYSALSCLRTAIGSSGNKSESLPLLAIMMALSLPQMAFQVYMMAFQVYVCGPRASQWPPYSKPIINLLSSGQAPHRYTDICTLAGCESTRYLPASRSHLRCPRFCLHCCPSPTCCSIQGNHIAAMQLHGKRCFQQKMCCKLRGWNLC